MLQHTVKYAEKYCIVSEKLLCIGAVALGHTFDEIFSGLGLCLLFLDFVSHNFYMFDSVTAKL